MLLKPSHEPGGVVDDGGQVADSMPFVRISDQDRLDAVLQQGIKQLHGLLRRRATIERPANMECWGAHLVRMHDGAAQEILSTWVGVDLGQKQIKKKEN